MGMPLTKESYTAVPLFPVSSAFTLLPAVTEDIFVRGYRSGHLAFEMLSEVCQASIWLL